MLGKACMLALQDYCHEKMLSACVILSLAAVLAPLLVLYGVKFGVISTMTDRLKNDPNTLEIIPVSSGRYDAAFFDTLTAQDTVAFVMPRTRSIAATMSLSPHNDNNVLSRVRVSLEPTGPHDPLLERYLPSATANTNTSPHTAHKAPQETFGVTLSAEAARKLRVTVGDMLTGRVERTNEGRTEAAQVFLWVEGILPLAAQQKAVAFVPLPLLEATEDFRDGRRPHDDSRLSADKGWRGETQTSTKRVYPAFRLYARSLEDVEDLRVYFETKGIDVFTQAEQIAAVFSLSASLNLIFGLIGTAAALGFWASTSSNALATVRRKERHLGILRLMGFSSADIMAFPLFQAFLTGILGTLLATGLYSITALLIDYLFAYSLQGIEKVCSLPIPHLGAALGIVLALSLWATLFPAARAARIEPSEVIRDV